jgi:hypothetical protein
MKYLRHFALSSIVLAALWADVARSEEPGHRLYVGLGVTHLSNVDAGSPFNDKYEDNADHYGVDVEYQYRPDTDGDYAYFTFGIGHTKSKKGWDCSGCKLPSTIRIGYKWRLM